MATEQHDLSEKEDIFADLDNPVVEAPEAEAEPQPQAEIKPEQSAEPAQPQNQQQPSQDSIPAWRLREEAEARRRLEAELASLRQQVTAKTAEPKPAPDVFQDPAAFLNHGVDLATRQAQQSIDPIKQQLNQMRESFSQMMATQRFGADKVQTAYQSLGQAIQANDPEAVMVYGRMMNGSMDPYGDMMAWHQRRSVWTETGGNLEAYRNKIVEEARQKALEDPEFLQKAIEAARGTARNVIQKPVPANPKPLPSLNRATAAADDDEPEDVGEVLNQAFGSRR